MAAATGNVIAKPEYVPFLYGTYFRARRPVAGAPSGGWQPPPGLRRHLWERWRKCMSASAAVANSALATAAAMACARSAASARYSRLQADADVVQQCPEHRRDGDRGAHGKLLLRMRSDGRRQTATQHDTPVKPPFFAAGACYIHWSSQPVRRFIPAVSRRFLA